MKGTRLEPEGYVYVRYLLEVFSRFEDPRARFGHRGVALISGLQPTKSRQWVSNLFRKQFATSTDKTSRRIEVILLSA